MPTTNDIYLQRFDGVKWAEQLGFIRVADIHSATAKKILFNTPVTDSECSMLITQRGSGACKGLIIQQTSGFTVTNIFEVQNSAGNNFFSVGPDGSYRGNNGSSSGIFTIGQGGAGPYLKLNFNGGNAFRVGYDNDQFYIYQETSSLRRLVISDSGYVGIGASTDPGARLQISSGGAAIIGVIVKGYASQSANLQEWQDSAAAVLVSIDSSGKLTVGDISVAGGTISATTTTLGLFGATAVAQPTTGITAASFVANTSAIADDTATWDGYTVGQIVAALRTVGLLA